MTKTRTLTVSDLLATLPKSARILGFKNLSNSFLVYFKYVSYICSAVHLIRARRLAIFAAGIFYAYGFRYSSVPCGALMRPQPVSGGEQRGAELFCFLPVLKLIYCFILIVHQNEKNKNTDRQRSAGDTPQERPYTGL